MNNKILVFLILSLALLVVFAGNVSSLGLTPGRTTVDYEPGVVKDIGFEILNSAGDDLSLEVFARGELADFIEVTEENLLAFLSVTQ